MKLFVVAALLMVGIATALRFDLHMDNHPTCFEVEMDEAHAAQGKTVVVSYSSNFTLENGHSPSTLEIKTYYPRNADGISQGEAQLADHNNYMIKGNKLNKQFSFRITGQKAPIGGGLLGSIYGLGEKYVVGTYEICFRRHPTEGGFLSSIVSKAVYERASVTVHVFAGERYTKHFHEGITSQVRSADKGDGYSDDEHHDRALRHTKKSTGKGHHSTGDGEQNNKFDSLTTNVQRMDELTADVTEGVRELRRRHERFHETSESSFSRVWMFSVLTMSAMAFTFWRTYSTTTKTLKDKKLV